MRARQQNTHEQTLYSIYGQYVTKRHRRIAYKTIREQQERHTLCIHIVTIYSEQNRRTFETTRRNRKTGFRKGSFLSVSNRTIQFCNKRPLVILFYILYYIVLSIHYSAYIYILGRHINFIYTNTLTGTRTHARTHISHPFGDCCCAVEDTHEVLTH